MKKYHTIAFDLDGTLTDPKRGLTASFYYGLSKAGVRCERADFLEKFIGPPLRESFKIEYNMSDEQADRALYLFREYFGVYGWWDNELYDGIPELLASLKKAGKTIVLATSKPDVYSSKILKRFGILDYFDFAEGASFDSSREKKCDVLEYAMRAVGVHGPGMREGVVLIGDTKFDVEGARICGVDSIGVTYGYGRECELIDAGADYIAKSVADVKRILLYE